MNETTSLKALACKTLERLERRQISKPISTADFSKPKKDQSIAPLFDPSLLQEAYEERLAIAEYDGKQTPLHAQRIAYLDAFMAVLSTLPHEDQLTYHENWLDDRIRTAKKWLLSQNFYQPK